MLLPSPELMVACRQADSLRLETGVESSGNAAVVHHASRPAPVFIWSILRRSLDLLVVILIFSRFGPNSRTFQGARGADSPRSVENRRTVR